jgi:hypothetical protein
MDSLKALKDKLRAEKEAFTGGKTGEKYVRKSELEAAKLQRIRDEEEQEKWKKVTGVRVCMLTCVHACVCVCVYVCLCCVCMCVCVRHYIHKDHSSVFTSIKEAASPEDSLRLS